MFRQPIFARFEGSDICEAEGHQVRHNAPGLEMCRKLVEAGLDPERPLHIYRGSQLAMKIKSIGWGARHTIREDRKIGPVLVPYRAYPEGVRLTRGDAQD